MGNVIRPQSQGEGKSLKKIDDNDVEEDKEMSIILEEEEIDEVKQIAENAGQLQTAVNETPQDSDQENSDVDVFYDAVSSEDAKVTSEDSKILESNVIHNLIVQVEELLSHVANEDYQAALSSGFKLQLQDVFDPPSSCSAISKVEQCKEDILEKASKCDESSIESYDITWDVDFADMEKSQQHQKLVHESKICSSKSGESSEFSFLANESVLLKQIAQRKMLDLKRWYCMSRPHYKEYCGIAALVSCWNYLYSTLGHGSCKPLTQEAALTVLGFEDRRCIPMADNSLLMRWFILVNKHFSVEGCCYFLYKPHGRQKTDDVTSDFALYSLKKGLQSKHFTYVYHGPNHFFCPLGFEEVPHYPSQAYSGKLSNSDFDTWILVEESSRKYPGIHCKRWEDILLDLNTGSPEFTDIRNFQHGFQQQSQEKTGCCNPYCIITFQKCESGGMHSEMPVQVFQDGKRCEVDVETLITEISPPENMEEVKQLDETYTDNKKGLSCPGTITRYSNESDEYDDSFSDDS